MVAAYADTLDFTRWTVRMTTVEQSAPNADETSIDLTSRGLNMLRLAYFDDMQTVTDYLFAESQGQPEDGPPASSGLAVGHEVPVRRHGGRGLRVAADRFGSPDPDAQDRRRRPGWPDGCPICGQPWPEADEVPPGITLVPLEESIATNYTGVLIDARGMDFNYALFPRIVNEDGRMVYGPEFFLPNYAADRGSVGYYDNLAGALADDRVGFNPLRINAIRAAGKNSTDLVISNPMPGSCTAHWRTSSSWSAAGVVILTD